MVRSRAGAVLLFAFLAMAAQARAQGGPGWSAGAGFGLTMPDVDGTDALGQGVVAGVEWRPWSGRWYTPKLYGGALLTWTYLNDCAPGELPCEVYAREAFVGGKLELTAPIPRVAPFVEAGFGLSAGRFVARVGDRVDVDDTGVAYHVPVGLGIAFGRHHQYRLSFQYQYLPGEKLTVGGFVFGLDLSPPPEAAPPAPREAAPAPAPAPVAAAPSPDQLEPGPGPERLPEVEPLPEPPPKARGNWYLSGWLGYGGGAVNAPGAYQEIVAIFSFGIPLHAGAAVGVPVGPRLLAGVETGVVAGPNCFASINSATGPCDRAAVLRQLRGAVTWYPGWSGAPEEVPSGLFVRGGAGVASLKTWLYPADPDADPITKQRNGLDLLAGAGFTVALPGWARTTDAGIDLSMQRYGESPSAPESSWVAIFRFGVTFH